ncbi:hypothetical protein Dsin_023222 [Dipteronia sinensis]|uniref:3'-5' exonuclease domain-containing protein n=1 Tax=Dipteronia sinensis TaxID=43782 RepID=A0AAE0A3X0_9ROSI|nr:hypothetical protein Dsin_023222 [Dipteronia sinensis]
MWPIYIKLTHSVFLKKKIHKMIPAKFLSKIGVHKLEIEGVKVKASHVTDNTSVIDHRIKQLRASLNKKRPVVGIDVKVTVEQKQQSQTSNDLLIICGGNCCLVIKLANLKDFPSSIINLLADKKICFVGFGMYSKFEKLCNVAEVGQLAARVLKKPNLSKWGLEELDKEVRKTVTDKEVRKTVTESKADVATSLPGTGAGAASCPNWKAMVFSDEEMKYAIHDAYTCCVIGDKLLGMLNA